MEKEDIYKVLNRILTDILDLEESPNVTESTTSDDIKGWDSLTNIQLIVAIEEQLNIKFTAQEIMSWQNIGQMVDSITNK